MVCKYVNTLSQFPATLCLMRPVAQKTKESFADDSLKFIQDTVVHSTDKIQVSFTVSFSSLPFFGDKNEAYSLLSLQFHSPFSKHVMLLGRQKKSAQTHCERPRFMSRDGLRSSVKCLQLHTYIVLSPIVMEGHVRGSAACQGVSPGDILGNTRRSNYIVCNMLIGHSHSSGAGSPALVKLWLRIKQDWGKAVEDVHYCHIEWLLVMQSVPKTGTL